LLATGWHLVDEVFTDAKIEPIRHSPLLHRGGRIALARRKIYVAVFSGSASQDDPLFTRVEAAEFTAKTSLIIAIKDVVEERKLTQQEVARLCGTDQPTLSKVFRGRMESVTISTGLRTGSTRLDGTWRSSSNHPRARAAGAASA